MNEPLEIIELQTALEACNSAAMNWPEAFTSVGFMVCFALVVTVLICKV